MTEDVGLPPPLMAESGSAEHTGPPTARDGLGEATSRPTPTVDNLGAGVEALLGRGPNLRHHGQGEEVPLVIEGGQG